MLGAIAGDIIGSRFERRVAPAADFELFHADCRFTDDTVCTLAIADALLDDHDFGASLRRFCRTHPKRGYGGMFWRWFHADDAPAYGSWGNGAAMRVSAVGWLAATEAEATELAEAQAAVTHNHPDAIAAATAVALAIFLLRMGQPVETVRDRLTEQFGYDLDPGRALAKGPIDVSSVATAPAALAAALRAPDWEGAVRTAVCLGGDTDTVACIAGSIAEAVHGMPPAIAERARSYLTEDLLAVLDRMRWCFSPRSTGDGPAVRGSGCGDRI